MSAATERIYRTLDGRYVPHGHEDAAFLVAGVGGELPADFTGFDQTAPAPSPTPALDDVDVPAAADEDNPGDVEDIPAAKPKPKKK